MILNHSIQKVLDTARIEDVVRDYVDLKPRGANLTGLCPFHKEKTPSFSVSPSKNIFKCFGCGKAGDPVSFLMEVEQFSFVEAIRSLAKRYHIEVEETELSNEARAEELEIQSLNIINNWALEYYLDQLWNTPEGRNIGLGYFKERGFLENTLKQFGIGFAKDAYSLFTQASIQKGYSLELLKKLGLTTASENDFFRNRIIFPLFSQSGKVIGFAGRVLGQDNKIAKYINSPESPVYKKSKTLFGLNLAKNEIRRQNNCILVEGYTDVMSLYQSGIENVVASSGTALTEDQIHMIKRHCDTITILYDGDAAGIKAAERGIELIVKEGMNVYLALIPDNDDPDSYIRKVGHEGFREFLKKEVRDFILFKVKILQEEFRKDPVKRSAVIQDIVGIISKIDDPIKRSLYIQSTAKELSIPEATLIESCNKLIREGLKTTAFNERKKALQNDEKILEDKAPEISFKEHNKQFLEQGDELQEKEIIKMIVLAFDKPWRNSNYSTGSFIIENILDILEYFDNPFYAMLIHDVIGKLQKNENINFQYFLNHPMKQVSSMAVECSSFPYVYSENWENKYGVYLNKKPTGTDFTDDEIESVIKHLKYRKFNKVLSKLDSEIAQCTEPGEISELIKTREEIKKVKNKLYQEVWKTEE